MKKSNFLFFGSPEFAAIVLEKLIKAGFAPAAVICNSDRPVGRKKIITPPETKIIAQKYGIDILQPEKLNSDFKIQIVGLKPDFFVVAAYAQIIPQEILDIPRLGTIGIHPSLLPKYRGATPIQSVILDGENETGTTIFLIDKEMDHGPILANSKFQITNHKYKELEQGLADLSGDLLVETLPKFLAGVIIPQEQNHSQATFTKKFQTEDAFISPDDLEKAQNEGGEIAYIIDRKIRAFNSEPGAWTQCLCAKRKGTGISKRVKLLEARIVDGKLKLTKIQEEGKTAKVL